jgi:hypothetical protein
MWTIHNMLPTICFPFQSPLYPSNIFSPILYVFIPLEQGEFLHKIDDTFEFLNIL